MAIHHPFVQCIHKLKNSEQAHESEQLKPRSHVLASINVSNPNYIMISYYIHV